MTTSRSRFRQATHIIERITRLLDDGYLAELVDDPIDRAVDQYLLSWNLRDQNTQEKHSDEPVPLSHIHFHDIISDFVGVLHADISTCLVKLSPAQARCHAIALLQQAYEGTHANGYHAALLDANNPQQAGLSVVLTRLAQIIKTQKHQAHTRWVFAYHIGPGDWETNCAIVAILLNRCTSLLPALHGKKSYPPEQFVSQIPDLLGTVLATDQLAGQVFCEDFSQSN